MNESDKLVIAAIAESNLANKVFRIGDAERFIFNVARQLPSYAAHIQDGKDPCDSLSLVDEKSKNAILEALKANNLLTICDSVKGLIPHLFRPTLTPIKGKTAFPLRPQLNNDEDPKAEFKVDIPLDPISTFTGVQYLQIKTKPPVLAAKYAGQYDPTDTRIKYRYTPKPGVRAFRRLELVSDSVVVQPYTQQDVLRFDKEMVPENLWHEWNDLINHDLGHESVVYNQFTESEVVTTARVGYQTPKHDQIGLDLMVPLFFDYNSCFDTKLNTTNFLPGTLQVQGLLENSNLIVRAEYYDDDITEDPVILDCEPLEIEEFNLISETFYVDEPLHCIMNCKGRSVFVRYWHSQVASYVDRDPIEPIEIKGSSATEAYTIAIRPRSYRYDFDKWIFLSEVEKVCIPCCILTPSAPGVFNNVAVKPSISYIPKSPLTEIHLRTDTLDLKPSFDVRYYGAAERYRVARNHRKFNPRTNELYKFNIDYMYKDNRLTGVAPNGKLKPVTLTCKFKTEYLNNYSLLTSDWEIIIFRDIFNHQIGSDSALATRYPL